MAERSWLVPSIAFLVSVGLGLPVLWLLRRGAVLDVPNMRSSHSHPTPRGGGVALSIGLAIAGMFLRGPLPLRAGLVLGSIAVAGLGGVEDVRGVRIGVRLLVQAVVAGTVAMLLLHGVAFGASAMAALAVLVTVWIVAFVNGFNFMDGINGISAIEAIVAGLAYAWLGRGRTPLMVDGGLAVAGAAAGFLPFNFPRAAIFLGDVGSYSLGAWLSILAVVAVRSRVGFVGAMAPLALYAGDTGVTLARRVLGHEDWTSPHRDHAYQRLVRAGWPHWATAAGVGLLVAACAGIGNLSTHRAATTQAAAAVAVIAIVGSYILFADRALERRRDVL